MIALRAIAIVIPARDEEQLIERTLVSVRAAIEKAEHSWGEAGPLVSVVVAADRCTDRTADIARSFDGVDVIELSAANVGRARASGVHHALTRINEPLAKVWVANTDADSVVPLNWLTVQADLARRRAGMMIGTVRPDFADLTPLQIQAWRAGHTPDHANGHVHGANLGVRADLYLAAGGFPEYAEHEDVELAGHVQRLGARVVASNHCEVMTSGRSHGRTPGGYSGYLTSELLSRTRPGPRHLSSPAGLYRSRFEHATEHATERATEEA